MNKRGQALIEFVLVVPVMILILFAIIDFSRIYYEKMRLENITSDIIEIMEENTTYEEVTEMIDNTYKDVDLILKYDSKNYIEITLVKKLTLLTPGLQFVLSNPYEVSTTRYIPYE